MKRYVGHTTILIIDNRERATAQRRQFVKRLDDVSCVACVKALLNSLPGMSCFELGKKSYVVTIGRGKDVINLVKSNATPIS